MATLLILTQGMFKTENPNTLKKVRIEILRCLRHNYLSSMAVLNYAIQAKGYPVFKGISSSQQHSFILRGYQFDQEGNVIHVPNVEIKGVYFNFTHSIEDILKILDNASKNFYSTTLPSLAVELGTLWQTGKFISATPEQKKKVQTFVENHLNKVLVPQDDALAGICTTVHYVG